MTTKYKKKQKQIVQYAHSDKERVNNPPAGLVTAESDPDLGDSTTWKHDPHIDPQLSWASKDKRNNFNVRTVSLHVHERIDPKTIIRAVRKETSEEQQIGLFEERRPFREAVEFYKHRDGWSNRLIAGDSLLVMNSLLQKESMANKVQMVYFDPPYGIQYGSNFQPFMKKPRVKKDTDESLSAEPEMIKAFRDTWELGIHSYLTYLRDRLLLAHDLLHESGSIFVQIGDENVHRVGIILDEVFDAGNRIATISFATTSGSSTAQLPQVADYLLWYAKDKKKIKYHQLYEKLNTRADVVDFFSSYVGFEGPDGKEIKLTTKERLNPDDHLPDGARIYQRTSLFSQGESTTGRSDPFEWQGQTFRCGADRQWSISHEGLDHLGKLGRLVFIPGKPSSLKWKKYAEEVPGRRITNIWPMRMYPHEKRYVVETSTRAITRCLLMATDPGDLVLDITCGGGTTAYAAERWGRRWITCDTSRIAITLAKHRLMTAHFDYYKLRHPEEGIGSGFEYESIDTYSPKILAENAPPIAINLYDRPIKERNIARVTGPFTVEAVPAPYATNVTSVSELGSDDATTMSPNDISITHSGETLRQHEWRDELQRCGIRGKNGQKIMFSRVEPIPCRYLHADAEIQPSTKLTSSHPNMSKIVLEKTLARAVISFGPEHAPLEPRQVELAFQEAGNLQPKPKMIVFAAFQFDPEAAKDIDETNWPGMTLLKVHMNTDLQTEDLKKKRSSSESFWLVGQPDVGLEQIRQGENTGKWLVEVRGFDYFNTRNGKIESGGKDNIVAWMLDTDYDGRSVYPSQVFFPGSTSKDNWTKLKKNLKAEIDEDLMDAYKGTISLPFDLGERKRVAVKIVDDRGTESLKIIEQYK